MGIERRRARCEVKHRRDFLVASAALGAALLLPTSALAAEIKVLQGGVRVNGKRASRTTPVRPGDTVETARGARVVFVIGEDAFLLRGDSKLVLENAAGGKVLAIAGLRLLTGGLLAAFAAGSRRIETPTATAGVRGSTGVYIEASVEQTYFCTCYGVAELRDKAGLERKMVMSGYHTPNMIYAKAGEHGKMVAAELKDHTDEELIMLERLVGRTSPIMQRDQRLKDASQPEPSEAPQPAAEPKTASEQSAAPKEQESQTAAQDNAPPKKSAQQAAPEDQAAPAPKPAPTKKARTQKQTKPAPKPPPETTPQPTPPPPPEPTPGSEMRDLGPAPTPPQEPQPAPQEYRLPPPRLD